MKGALLLLSHLLIGIVGFVLGIYALPILTQPTSPEITVVEQVSNHALFTGTFQRERQDSDFLHWGEGSVSLSDSQVVFIGELAPGPDYKLYLSPTYIETEAAFHEHKNSMVKVGDIRTFDRFSIDLPADIRIEEFNTVIVWCESFNQFITSARYN
ncbi:DM13 domain-containing protein [Vibrio ichthyoenteri]|uniref:DM13 domain-containing protein n=1 Tax=Vibrio ichthyoenteri TaxID=142461 RepID=UPI001575327E|nr:DM13 domain-containing protein [Vibrio ichthyoenteri]